MNEQGRRGGVSEKGVGRRQSAKAHLTAFAGKGNANKRQGREQRKGGQPVEGHPVNYVCALKMSRLLFWRLGEEWVADGRRRRTGQAVSTFSGNPFRPTSHRANEPNP